MNDSTQLKMRTILIATGEIAIPCFRYLLANGPRPLALVTQPDKPSGRHQALTPPAIKVEALAAGIPVFQPEKIGDVADELAALDPEVLVVMAYGQILRGNILKLPSKAIINLHASLLPRFRGAACIQAAIDAGDAETGITAMHVIRELDAGDMILKKSIPIHADETGGSLHDRLAELAPEVLGKALEKIAAGTAVREPQDPAASNYISKLERDDGLLHWSWDAAVLERRVRAYDPWPGTFTNVMKDGRSQRLKIFPPTTVTNHVLEVGKVVLFDGQCLVGCGTGTLSLSTVQPEGARRMTAMDYLRGHKPEAFGAG